MAVGRSASASPPRARSAALGSPATRTHPDSPHRHRASHPTCGPQPSQSERRVGMIVLSHPEWWLDHVDELTDPERPRRAALRPGHHRRRKEQGDPRRQPRDHRREEETQGRHRRPRPDPRQAARRPDRSPRPGRRAARPPPRPADGAAAAGRQRRAVARRAAERLPARRDEYRAITRQPAPPARPHHLPPRRDHRHPRPPGSARTGRALACLIEEINATPPGCPATPGPSPTASPPQLTSFNNLRRPLPEIWVRRDKPAWRRRWKSSTSKG